jgi:hypothetical protein
MFCGLCRPRAIAFCSNLLTAAAKEAGINLSAPSHTHPMYFLRSLPMEERRICLAAIASALRKIAPKQGNSSEATGLVAIRVILVNLEYSKFNQVVGLTLDEFLQGSWAGEILSSMRKHFANLTRDREEKAKFHSPECTKVRREKRQERHSKRILEKALRDQRRQEILKEFENMPPVRRLATIAASDSLPLEAIPSAHSE